MGFFDNLWRILRYEAEIPRMLGIFHITCLSVVFALTLLFCLKFKDASDKTVRRILLFAWLILLFTELYKQLAYSFSFDGDGGVSDYLWLSFPFQFCSMPLYVLPLAAFLKDGRFRDGIISFISTYLLFAGIAVMIYPGNVYVYMVGINIQTMIHHGAQVLVGFLLLIHTRNKKGIVPFLVGAMIFLLLAVAALAMNIHVYTVMAERGVEKSFNMFFLNPYSDCPLPILSAIKAGAPYPVFFLTYVLGFTAIAASLVAVRELILRLIKGQK